MAYPLNSGHSDHDVVQLRVHPQSLRACRRSARQDELDRVQVREAGACHQLRVHQGLPPQQVEVLRPLGALLWPSHQRGRQRREPVGERPRIV